MSQDTHTVPCPECRRRTTVSVAAMLHCIAFTCEHCHKTIDLRRIGHQPVQRDRETIRELKRNIERRRISARQSLDAA